MSVAAQGERGLLASRSERWAPVLATVLALLLVAATAEIVLDGALGHSALIPKSPEIAGWLTGIGERLGYRVFLIALLVFCRRLRGPAGARRALGRARRSPNARRSFWSAVLHADRVRRADPALDRRLQLHRLRAHGGRARDQPLPPRPVAIVSDPVYQYVGQDWKHVATAYGPLYTLLSYPLAPLGVKGALWGMKLVALLASAGTLALTWRCARVRGLDPVRALLVVGANPAVRDLRARRGPQRPDDDLRDDDRWPLMQPDVRRQGSVRPRRRSWPARS